MIAKCISLLCKAGKNYQGTRLQEIKTLVDCYVVELNKTQFRLQLDPNSEFHNAVYRDFKKLNRTGRIVEQKPEQAPALFRHGAFITKRYLFAADEKGCIFGINIQAFLYA